MDEIKQGGGIEREQKVNGEKLTETFQQNLPESPHQKQQEECTRSLPKQQQKPDPSRQQQQHQQQTEFQKFQLPKQQTDTDALEGMTGWQVAYRGIQLALNNEVEEAQKLLKGDSTCIHRQAGFCYLTFIVSE